MFGELVHERASVCHLYSSLLLQIAAVSPVSSSCERTLETLRYAAMLVQQSGTIVASYCGHCRVKDLIRKEKKKIAAASCEESTTVHQQEPAEQDILKKHKTILQVLKGRPS